MKGSRVERFARELPQSTVDAVRSASAIKVTQRKDRLSAWFGANADEARARAAQIKDFVLLNLKDLLLEFESNLLANGVQVHWAADAEAARSAVLSILNTRVPAGSIVAKGKSMVTEEIHLNHALEAAGYRPVETDLGEFVVQIDGDTPSHIVTPIIHKNRFQVARSFAECGLGPYSEDPETLTLQAREHLRDQFRQARAGISGVNFGIAKTGRLVIIENEGNNRLCTTAPEIHIALMGIEKLLPSEADLGLFLRLLAASATGQQVATYQHFVSGPRRKDEPDGPKEVHVVLVDNGRSRVLNGPYREILRCIRCGACQNVCPVFRQGSGHAYGHVYSGPIGAVLAPAMEGVEKLGDLAKASTLCGACEEACPVQIPIPHLLLELRHEANLKGAAQDGIPWKWFGVAAYDVKKWKAGIGLLPIATGLPNPAMSTWTEFREPPQRVGREFRRWWRERS